ncbi:MAG TPA: spore coat U domain-containing protein [Acetobacteraceae bacterium]|jgi:spore coat protein U-like protein|nr:spore coat U domain-containing protein [Acetobacteraceae bacterium]
MMLVLTKKRLATGCALLGALAVAAPLTQAVAATANTTFQVTATVVATCLINANPLPFGNYTGTQTDATSSISVTCTNTTPYNVGLDAGTSTGATVNARKMVGPAGATLGYALFRDAARTQNWGNTVGADTQTGTGNGSAQTLTVFGRIPANAFPVPGGYADTITATITY